MTEPALIHAVLLEDDDLDAELLRERLLADGLRVDIRRARDRAEFEVELERGGMDIILSDFSLPGYDGLAALDTARVRAAEVPFIFVSGAIGEERAIETLRRGATDYVLKDRLERLTPAVARALDAADERRKRRAAEVKDEFLAIVSHELRTPLNAILGWATLLASGAANPRMLEKGLATIERNAHAQSRLIEDILDISRVVTGNLQLRKANVPVASFVREAARPSADAKAITISVDVGDVGSALGDSDRLQQIVGNLLSNAVKFTPQGGKVSVAALVSTLSRILFVS